ncbi:MAG: NSR1-nuclear localization sequence binding protein [candidate division WS6 bacterium GW2011_GWF2_39_15]|uniref:NSR1-nuclear localization sequence binding protein n=1 Tax=candidate division WS6 bacterium GW2011_GWF2_39_15 TaxID=1619100 RepID=A0A0G0N008_9BACT|nr:MAG: NSR1-nuclear localization sequence binding protein [candidate division WS6 bacterium GW2011_GWF2_39_15]
MENTKLFVGGLSWNLTTEDLKKAFEEIGEVVEAVIIMDRDSGKSKGFGFVTMKTAEDAQKAIAEMNGKELDGKAITVNEARPMKPRM